jgi:cytochrome c1
MIEPHSGVTLGSLAAVAGIAGATSVSTAFASGSEAEDGLHAPHFHWSHDGMLGAFDHWAIRRGHQVYQQVRVSLSVYHPAWDATLDPVKKKFL